MSSPKGSGHDRSTSDGSSFTSSVEFEPSVIDDLVLEKYSGNGQHDVIRGTHHHRTSMKLKNQLTCLGKLMAIICVLTVVLQNLIGHH